ncbi:hypothetical protein LEN26_004368 [Aphanomyces euteiches]|nr:hypothetical protein LEN26_004368 [Aphanomyces euteiches]
MANMSMQFMSNMTLTQIIVGVVPVAAASANNHVEMATQRCCRQQAASEQHRYQAYDDRLNCPSNDHNDEPRGYNDRPYYIDHRNADYSYHACGLGGRGGSRRRSQSRPSDRGSRQYSPDRRATATPATSTKMQFNTVVGSYQLFLKPDKTLTRQLRLISLEVIDLVSAKDDAVAEPIEALQPIDAQAPLVVEEASGAQEPLEAPETAVGEAQPEAMETADAQPRAEVPEVGAQAPLEVAEDVDVNAQEVADAQATANVNLVAGDDDDATAPLDAGGPT